MQTKNPLGMETILQYEFNDKNLLKEALRHSSFVNELGETGLRDNERLEFLGDAVLNLNSDDQFDKLIVGLKEMGIQGVEALYSGHSAEQSRLFSKLARHHDLTITGGTDFHGAIQPEIALGTGKGNLFVPYEVYANLIRR